MKKIQRLIGSLFVLLAVPAMADWVYYPAGHVSNPHPDKGQHPVIADGTWVLNVEPLPKISAKALKLGCSDADKAALYGGISRGIAFTGIGSGALDLRGTIHHADSDTDTYYLHGFGYQALGASNDAKSRTGTMTSCRTPGTLRYFGGQDFNCEYKIIQSIVVDEPLVTGNYNHSWTFPDNLKHLELNLPGIRKIALANVINNVYQDAPYTNRFDQWNLSGVTQIVERALCQIGKMSGTLSLPSLENAGNYAFTNTAFTSVILGKPGVTTTFGTAAFDGCKAMREMVLRGNPPATLAGAWGTDRRAARTMVFAVPLNEDSWQTFLSGKVVRAVEAEEAAAFMSANPDVHAVPAYVVSAAAFGTANEQYLAGIAEFSFEWDDYFGDAVVLESADRKKTSEGEYPIGTHLSLLATTGAAAGAKFAGWYGDTDGATIETDPAGAWSRMTLTLSKRTWVFARFTHPWNYVASRGTASNGKWTVNVKPGSSAGKLTLGNNTPNGLFTAGSNVGVSGVIDLGGPVSDGVNAWTFSLVDNKKGLCCASNDTAFAGKPTVFVSPSTCEAFNGGQLFNAPDGCTWTYETIIIDEPTATGNIPDFYIGKQMKCRRLVLRAPKLEGIGKMGAFGTDNDAAPLDLTDLGWWRLDSLSRVETGTFLQNYNRTESDVFKGVRAIGSLSLPSCTVVDSRAFCMMPNLRGVTLGGAKKTTKLTSVGAKAFAGCGKLTEVTLYSDPGLSVASDAFAETSVFSLRFLGPAPSSAALSAILPGAAATAPAARSVSIYASDRFAGWAPGAGIVSSLDESERAVALEGTFGVWRDGAAAPAGKAWVVRLVSPYDPNGMKILLR